MVAIAEGQFLQSNEADANIKGIRVVFKANSSQSLKLIEPGDLEIFFGQPSVCQDTPSCTRYGWSKLA